MMLRLLHPQGIAGLAAAICLAALLVLQTSETRRWRKQSRQYELLYRTEQAAFAGTVANYRAAADAARAADKAAADRARAEQAAINERSSDALETRLADARARAQRLRVQTSGRTADRGSGRTAPMPGLSAAAAGAAQSAGQERLPDPGQRARIDRGVLGPEDALIATEQAIQLDELIEWVKAQSGVAR